MRRGIWILFSLLLLALCLLYPSGVSAACLGAWVLLPPVSLVLVWAGSRKHIDIQMEAQSVTEKGSPISLSLKVKPGRLPIGPVGLRLQVENCVTGQRVQSRVFLQETQTIRLKSDYCGCLSCTIDRVGLWDWWGIFFLPLKIKKKQKILVMPHTFPVEVAMESAPALSEDCQEYAQDRKGQDRTETYQLRDYVPGDSIGQIHWKLTSKRGHPVVREAACPVDQSLMIFVDRCTAGAAPAQTDGLMEAAASVAQALTEQGLSFRLCWNEETIHTETVNEGEQLPEALGALLKSKSSHESGTAVYLRTCGVPSAGRLIYLGTQYPEEAFCQCAPCKTLVCGQGITAEALAQDLRILSWS